MADTSKVSILVDPREATEVAIVLSQIGGVANITSSTQGPYLKVQFDFHGDLCLLDNVRPYCKSNRK